MSDEEVDIKVITGFDVIPATVAGFECVALLVGTGTGEATEHVVYAVASEEALEIAGALRSIAATIRPFTVQQRIKSAIEAGEENSK